MQSILYNNLSGNFNSKKKHYEKINAHYRVKKHYFDEKKKS